VRALLIASLVLCACGGILSACGEPLAPPWLIDEPRVLGAHIEITGDPGRSSPHPGEEATVRWIVVSPEGIAPMHWRLEACLPDEQGGCATRLAEGSGDGAPTLAFTAPESAGRVVVSGVLCDGGSPAASGCDGGTGTVVTLAVPMAGGGENRSPSLAGATFTVGGQPWPATDDCAALPAIAADGQKRALHVSVAGQREVYLSTANAEGVPRPVRETLQLSHFTTAGKLPRQLSFVESADERDPAELEVEWTPPPAAEIPAEGAVVHFHFVVRDLRGGLDWQTRTLCVTPTGKDPDR
jgi:hypothetical protein